MRGNLLGMGAFDEAAFLGECVGIQPFQKVCGIGSDHLHLREMQVHVDEAGHDQMRTVVDFGDLGRRLGLDVSIGADSSDDAILDQQTAVCLVEVALAIGEAERSAAEGEKAPAQECHGHSCLPSTALSNQATSSLRSSGVMSVTFPGGMAWLRPACI